MKAVVYRRYGPPEVLHVEDVPVPDIRPGDVLVRVRAASVNSWDHDLVSGHPLAFRFWGVFRPRHSVPGADIAGIVEAVGASVTRFHVGDAVFGDLSGCGWGGFAEFAAAPESALTPMPERMAFEQAAAIPQAGAMALQGLRAGGLATGQEVLVNGGGGGVGTFAIQIAVHAGARVTGVDTGRKLEVMRSCGASTVMDFTTTDPYATDARYDLILDTSMQRPPHDAIRALRPGGAYVVLGGTPGRLLRFAASRPLLARRSGCRVVLLAARANLDLPDLADLVGRDVIRPVIDGVFPIGDIAGAFRRYATGESRGKVVVTV